VENAIFKVHRYFLAKYSSVISDMFDSPQGSEGTVGTDDNPLVLTGDTACGWELLLDEIYNR
jgi:BTB/POZ domain